MGKASRWFRSIFGAKKRSDSPPASELSRPTREKKKWGFVKSFDNRNYQDRGGTKGSYADASYVEEIDANKHAIAVAAATAAVATAAVAEAALAAAHAAAEVVRLTSGGSGPATASAYWSERRRELAAVKIQSAFRAYLARRALRALKGLVRLQALVRGHIVRKQSANMLQRMQAMARIQARASANRAHVSGSSLLSSKSSHSCHPGLATPKKNDSQLRAYGSTKYDRSSTLKSSKSNIKTKGNVDLGRTHLGSSWLDRWMEECSRNSQGDTSLRSTRADDERSDKILEVDTWKPHLNSTQSDKIFRAPFDPLKKQLTKTQKQKTRSISSGEVLSLGSLKFPIQCTSENSPQVCSASSRPGSSSGRRGPFAPARSECSRSLLGDFWGYPNYMANTESSWAKVRSQSAPRQRMQVERLGSTKRFIRGYLDGDTISEMGLDSHDNFSTRAYTGSRIPVRGNNTASCNSSYGGRC